MKSANTVENHIECLCAQCPTYVQGAPGVFCATDKSPRIKQKKGCICTNCHVWMKNHLSGGYFCIEGMAR
ncbi:MAG: DUF2769 domain-containing protein [Candidatus Zixiibacteriota bacterium]|nr:MAG: DUF2769 domain-containing protein [candidate division Zixibacteria bacterium]